MNALLYAGATFIYFYIGASIIIGAVVLIFIIKIFGRIFKEVK